MLFQKKIESTTAVESVSLTKSIVSYLRDYTNMSHSFNTITVMFLLENNYIPQILIVISGKRPITWVKHHVSFVYMSSVSHNQLGSEHPCENTEYLSKVKQGPHNKLFSERRYSFWTFCGGKKLLSYLHFVEYGWAENKLLTPAWAGQTRHAVTILVSHILLHPFHCYGTIWHICLILHPMDPLS